MLLSLLLSTASASEAPLPPVTPPQAQALQTQTEDLTLAPVSAWTPPPQLPSDQGHRLMQVQMLAGVGTVLTLGAASLSTLGFVSTDAYSLNRALAGANAVVFAVPGIVLGALSLAPAIHLSQQGVRWSPTLGVASVAAGVGSLFVAAYTRNGTIPDESYFLAAGLAWASPVLALAEVLLASRAAWMQAGSAVSLRITPSHQGGNATMTWSF